MKTLIPKVIENKQSRGRPTTGARGRRGFASRPRAGARPRNAKRMGAPLSIRTNGGIVTGGVEGAAPIPATVESTGGAAVAPSPRGEPFVWDKDEPVQSQTQLLCERLAATGMLYRDPEGGIFRLEVGCDPVRIETADHLEGYIREKFDVIVVSKGDQTARSIPARELKVLMISKRLQTMLPAVDCITAVVTYNGNWELTQPGYSGGGEGDRCFYTGHSVTPKKELKRITEFLDVMNFATAADRTNAVAAGLTVILRFMWNGNKPFIQYTANRSHAGKDTVLDFTTGLTKRAEISWHYRDWATQNEAVAALYDPAVGVLAIGNIRSKRGAIESSFIERTVTAERPLLQSSKLGSLGLDRKNDFVITATANEGRFSTDLMNRALPIHLELVGDPADRKSPIGDPRYVYLPKYREEIQAEFIGMIEKWKEAGKPLDETVKHSMKEWAQTIGGILKANGFTDFLGNWGDLRVANDMERESLAIVADKLPHDKWLRVSEIRQVAQDQGVIRKVMDSIHKESDASIERQLGILFTKHAGDTLSLMTDGGKKSYKVCKRRFRAGGEPVMRYRFDTVTPAEVVQGEAAEPAEAAE